MEPSPASNTEMARVTIEVPAAEVQEFKDYLRSVSQSTVGQETQYCCYLTIKEPYSGEKHKQIPLEADSLNRARAKCVAEAYDEWDRNRNNQVSSSVERGSCTYFP
jgi:hypothetical protein